MVADYIPPMTQTIQDRIETRLAELGISAREASLRAGKGADLIRRILERPNASPRADTVRGLARALSVTEQWLLTGEETAPPVAQTQPDRSPPAVMASRPKDEDGLLPILGTAAGSFAGAFEIEGRAIGYVEKPPALRDVPFAYAVYVTGSSMEPEHRHGDLRFIDPSRPARVGETVVVQTQNEPNAPVEGYLGHLVRQTGERVVVKKLNPVAEVAFDHKVVLSVHRVMTINDMYGR